MSTTTVTNVEPIRLQSYPQTREIVEAMPPAQAAIAKQRWNAPDNKWRVFAACVSFFICGMNDGSYGALIPHLERYYHLNYTIVSLIFLSPFVGYTLSSVLNNYIHVKFGQRGVAIVGPLCHLVPYIIVAIHPPYAVLVVMFVFIGFGNGLIDAAWCAWIGDMADANVVSGVLQASYSLGATVSPLIATGIASKGWFAFYYIMIAASALEVAVSSVFWKQDGAAYEAENPRVNASTGRTRQALKLKVSWLFCLFVFGYVGAEVSLGGWIITFMTKVRGAAPFASSAASTAYWGGMTVGRLILPFLTARLGEYPSVLLYLALSAGLELIFWLVPNLVVSAVAVALLGFFMGPMFPTAIVIVTKLLPKDLHVGCIGFGTAFGGSGGAIFPFLIGAIAQSKGVRALQPVILALLATIAVLWAMLPRKQRYEEEETDVDEVSG